MSEAIQAKESAQAKESRGLSWNTLVAYSFGDVSCNVVVGAINTILTLFYTDYVGISPVIVGMVMLSARIFDGVSDVLMGFIVERTKSRWGKSRPWLLWMSVPFALSSVLLFAVPQSTEMVQFIYMFVTYNFCTTVCYTAINLPYSSLSTMMTRSSTERAMLSIFRMGISPFGRILAATLTLPVVKLFGDDQMAWIKTMSIWATIALVLLLICFWRCEETVRIEANKNANKVPFKTQVSALACNQYFWASLVLWTCQCSIYVLVGTIVPYYCKYVLGDVTWTYSFLFLTESLLIVAVTFLCPLLLKRFGKRDLSLAGIIVCFAGQLIFFINPYDFNWMLASCVIRAIGLAPLNAVLFGFMGDAVEFGQWKTHIRQEGMIFAGSSVGMKVSSGLVAAAITGLMGLSGYISSTGVEVVQPQAAVEMIVDIYKYGPLIIWAVLIATLYFYKLDRRYPKIMRDLVEREARGEL
jgi:GPH family glycoside/pentoside/hexuronide:cation symporter